MLKSTQIHCCSKQQMKCVFCRDDLYRVELDNMAGDEMFYSKVRADTMESGANSNRALNAALSSRNEPGSLTRMTFECVGWRANTRYEILPQIHRHRLHHHINKTGAVKHICFLFLEYISINTTSTSHCKHVTEPRRATWCLKATFFPTYIVSFVFWRLLYSDESQKNRTILKW